LGSSERIKELNKDYGWNLILKSLCPNIQDLEKTSDLEFGTVISWLELGKAQEEIEHIVNEQFKNKMKK